MWIEIKVDIFESEQNLFELRKLIQDLCYKHKYNVFIDLPLVQHFSTYKTIYDELKYEIEAFHNRYHTENPIIEHEISDLENGKDFNIKEAIIFFNTPFQIILENSDNDGHFLDAIIREFRKGSKKIKQFKDEHWLEYGNAGGSGNIIHFIERIKKDFNNSNKFLNCFVLLDSDLEYPQTINQKRKSIVDYLNNNCIPFHILEKREIENYLQDDVLEKIAADDMFIKSYLLLTPHQKDYIDLEKGLVSNLENLSKNKVDVYEFFLNSSESKKETETKFNNLRNGITNRFDNFKNDFPKLFEQSTQLGFLDRCKHQNNPMELKEILNKISKLL